MIQINSWRLRSFYVDRFRSFWRIFLLYDPRIFKCVFHDVWDSLCFESLYSDPRRHFVKINQLFRPHHRLFRRWLLKVYTKPVGVPCRVQLLRWPVELSLPNRIFLFLNYWLENSLVVFEDMLLVKKVFKSHELVLINLLSLAERISVNSYAHTFLFKSEFIQWKHL